MDWTFIIAVDFVALLILIVLAKMGINNLRGKDELDGLFNFFGKRKDEE
jgi:hypothetical protein